MELQSGLSVRLPTTGGLGEAAINSDGLRRAINQAPSVLLLGSGGP